jgi:hypothetical protein
VDPEELDAIIENTRHRVEVMRQLRERTMALLKEARDATEKSEKAALKTQESLETCAENLDEARQTAENPAS